MSRFEGRPGGCKKSYAYAALFIIFKIMVIVVLAQTLMKIRNPKLRLGTVVGQRIKTGSVSGSFNITLITEVTIENTNFGPFRYDATPLNILYSGIIVGRTMIPKNRADARKTKRFAVYVAISSDALSGFQEFNNGVNSSVLFLTSQARVSGMVTLMIWKKKKSAELICAMAMNLATTAISELTCE